MSEDKITKLVESEMSAYFDGEYIDNGNVRTRLVEFAKACAAIKDAEIAKLQKHNQDLRANALANEQANYDQVAKLVNEIAARDLMIKELREALQQPVNFDAQKEALAKTEHYNFRALEKMRLEAIINAFKDVEGYDAGTVLHNRKNFEKRLAELNKE